VIARAETEPVVLASSKIARMRRPALGRRGLRSVWVARLQVNAPSLFVGSSEMSARAVEVGEFTLAPRECSLGERDRMVRDIAQPLGGLFEWIDPFDLSP
jgi:hypothetical protein